MEDPDILDALDELLHRGAETGVQEALRALRGSPGLAERVARCCLGLPLGRLPVLALALRWLRQEAPGVRDRLHQEARERVREALRSGGEAEEAWLVLAPPSEEDRAAQERLAGRLLATLAEAPRTLSQANAEELLARRVYEQCHHFFFELLQNADDAGARWVQLGLGEERELWLRHDGQVFGPRDVLGVLSVGQSTKDEASIGLFGVGFKSVAAISERPRIYSGPYAFEIIALARPRPVDPAPVALDQDTLFALPLRPEIDATGVLKSAAELPAEVLLTLRHVEAIELRPAPGAPGGRRTRSVQGAFVELHRRDGPRRYRVAALPSPVLVAIPLDARGLPVPLPPDEPSLYCFLPTREDTGLPFLLHARFEVPLDRERIRQDSPRNQQLLQDAGALVASIVQDFHTEGRPDAAGALLSLLASAQPRAYFARPLEEARRRLGLLPLFPGADGEALAAARGYLSPPGLAPLLAGLPSAGRRPLGVLTDEQRRRARWLGATELEPQDLLTVLVALLDGVAEGAAPSHPLLAATASLAEHLARLPASCRPQLAALPWVQAPGPAGPALWRPASVRLASGLQASLYGALRPLRIEDEPAPAALGEVGLRWLTDGEILDDLRDERRREALLQKGGIEPWLAYLARLGPALLEGLGALPLFPDIVGNLRTLTGPEGAWLWPEGPLEGWLAGLQEPPPRLVRREVSRRHGGLLRALGGKAPGVEALLTWVQERGAPLEAGEAEGLVAVAEDHWRGWSARAVEALGRAPLFLDRHGQRRPLRGAERALRAEDEALAALAPEPPWLAEHHQGSTLVEALAPALGPAAVLTSMLGEGPLFDVWPDLSSLIRYLEPRSRRLPWALRERLAEAPRWPGVDGERKPLSELSRPTEHQELEQLYRALGLRPRITGDGLELARILGLDGRLGPGDLDGLLAEIKAGKVELSEHRDAVLELLQRERTTLPPGLCRRLAGLPLWQDEGGTLRALAPWSIQSSDAPCYRASWPWRGLLALGSRPLLSEQEEARWGPLLEQLAVPRASAQDALSALEHDPKLLREELRLQARAALRECSGALTSPSYRERLARLPLWRDREGSWCTPERLVHPEALDALLGAPSLALLPGVPSLLHPEDLADAAALAPLLQFRPPIDLLDEALRSLARPGLPLDQQPPLLSSLAHIRNLHTIAATHRITGWPLGVDATGALSAERLFGASEGERRLLAGSPLLRRVAWPGWHEALGLHPEPLPPVRLLEALPAAWREGGEGAVDDEAQQALFRWIEEREGELERDMQARGLLGKLAVFPTREGELRTARRLLLVPGLEGLSLPGRPAPGLPQALLSLLARLFRLEEGALGALLDALLDACHEAAERSDIETLRRLNLALVAALGGPGEPEQEARVDRLLRHHRVARRLRVVSGEGTSHKARQLLHGPVERHRLVQIFHTDAPPRYEGPEELISLLERLGMKRWLDGEELRTLLRGEGRREGAEAALALGCYLAEALAAAPSLRSELGLDRAPWVPTADGTLQPPGAVYWPAEEADEGRDRVHPVFARSAPQLRARFGFRREPPAEVSTPTPPRVTPAPPKPSPPTSTAPPRGLWDRFFGPRAPAPAPPQPAASPPAPLATRTPEPTPSARRDGQEGWYRPRDEIRPQLENTEGWSEARQRRPRYGFAHAPGKLPPPYLYAPSLIATRFDPQEQRWRRGEVQPRWWEGTGAVLGRVRFQGRLPQGQALLPLPLYGELVQVEAAGRALTPVRTPDGGTLLMVPEGELFFEVQLREAPTFQDTPLDLATIPRELLEPTVPDAELPLEVHEWLAALDGSLSPLSRTLAVRDFVRTRYRYDPSYLEDVQVGRWLRRAVGDSKNFHIAALHAGRAGKFLGAGVCYELNGLCCELVRRVGVPAGVSTGWVLDGGQADEPDHLWVMALLPSRQGPRFLPLDASSTEEGQPLRVARRPAGDFRRPTATAQRLPPTPTWAARQPVAPRASEAPVTELARTLRYLAQQQGQPVPEEGALRRQARAILEDPVRASELLKLLRPG
jgi:hypothetical protein